MKAAFGFAGLMIVAIAVWFGIVPGGTSNVLVEDAVARPLENGDIGIFLTINNQGRPDKLVSVSSSARDATLHAAFGADNLPIQVGRSSLASDAAHIRITAGDAPFEVGALVPVTLGFEEAGDVQLKARMSQPAMQGHAGMAMTDNMPAMHTGISAPSVSVSASAAGDGWRIAIAVENFKFSEEDMGAAHEPGIGHAHIYAGGIKLGRVFGADYMIGQLPKGSHDIRVTLNTNDHRPYMTESGPVTATTVIEVD